MREGDRVQCRKLFLFRAELLRGNEPALRIEKERQVARGEQGAMSETLKTSLKIAHSGTAMRFAFVANGTTGKLLVAKLIAPAQMSEAKKQAGSGQAYQGRCVGEDGILFFEVDKDPPGSLLGQLKRCVKDDGGQTWPIEFRIVGDAAPEPGTSAPHPPGKMPPAAERSLATRWAKRREALEPRYAATVKEKRGDGDKMKAVFSFAVDKAGRGEYDKALAAMDSLEKLLNAAPAAAPPPPENDADTQFKNRFKSLLIPVSKAVAAKHPASDVLRRGVAEAQALAGKRDFVHANAILDRLEKLLTSAANGSAKPPAAIGLAEIKARANAVKLTIDQVKAADPARGAELTKQLAAALGSAQGRDLTTAQKQLDALEAAAKAAARWEAARAIAVARLQEQIKVVVAIDHPDVGKAELELQAVMRQLEAKVETRQQAAEMARYLHQDEVVADVCDLAFDLKTPLLQLLSEITPQLAA